MARWMALLAIAVTAGQAMAAPAPAAAPALKTRKDKVSYGIGVNMGKSFRQQGVEVTPEIFLKGLKDGLAGAKLQLSEAELQDVMNAYQTELRRRQKAAGEVNRREGFTFLQENKEKPGVVALPSGLQYKILKAGTGPKAAAAEKIACRYRGTLIDGTEFEDSGDKPANLDTLGLIAGWKEAIPLMTVGSKWRLFIPPSLAYGPKGHGRGVPPMATVIFDLELVSAK